MQVLGGEHGQVRALSLRELCVRHMPTAELCAQTRYTHSQPLALSIPGSNACPSCPLGPRLYIIDSQLKETYRDYWFIPPQRRKQNIPELPFFSSPRRCSPISLPHFHLIVKNQRPTYSLFCQLKAHVLCPIASL